MTIYKIKRFGRIGSMLGGAFLGGYAGGAIGMRKSDKAAGIGSVLGALGGAYLGYKMDKCMPKPEPPRIKDDRKNISNESESVEIMKLGGLPKEYHQMNEICKKIDSSARYPDWGDGDEYMSPWVTGLNDIEDILLNRCKFHKGSINDYPLIWIGYQGECELVYDFNKRQWFDISYSPRKRVTNLKSHILKLYENNIKNYGCDEKGPYLDEEDIKQVQNYYTDIIRIIKSSKIG